ncbi:unnamed protein product, partial [Rotaria sp. Silwood1]
AYHASNSSLVKLTLVFTPIILSTSLPSSLSLSLSSYKPPVADVNMTLSSKLQLAYYIVIALTGLIGNTTTIIVFSQRRLRSLRSSFFLTCLAVTDLIFILILDDFTDG